MTLKRNILTVLLLLAFGVMLQAQNTDSTEKKRVKTGWNFGALPAVSFNTDLGFQ